MGAGLGAGEILFRALPRSNSSARHGAAVWPIMSVLRIILGDQLSLHLSALNTIDTERDIVLMMEVVEENTYVKHHKQKSVLVLAAMRHFAESLRQRGLTVDYVKLDAPDNSGSFTTEVQRAVARHRPSRIVMTEPSEWRVQALVEGWSESSVTSSSAGVAGSAAVSARTGRTGSSGASVKAVAARASPLGAKRPWVYLAMFS